MIDPTLWQAVLMQRSISCYSECYEYVQRDCPAEVVVLGRLGDFIDYKGCCSTTWCEQISSYLFICATAATSNQNFTLVAAPMLAAVEHNDAKKSSNKVHMNWLWLITYMGMEEIWLLLYPFMLHKHKMWLQAMYFGLQPSI